MNFSIDKDYLRKTLVSLLNIPSPSGYTDQIVHFVGNRLQAMGIPFDVTRRGAIRANLKGEQNTLDRAITVHLDTLGAMVISLKDNGRLAIAPVGTWSSRFAEGARVTIFSAKNAYRGTILPLKASGHTFGDAVDSQPVSWKQLEIRIDEHCCCCRHLEECGIEIGDYVALDTTPEITSSGFINARYLDDKAGAAVLLAVAKCIVDREIVLPVDCHLLFTILEEVGIGASGVLYGDIAEMVVIDSAPVAPGQHSTELGVTIAMMDQAGPFDYHLNRKLAGLCRENGILFRKDVLKFYRSDSASAIEAGSDTRTALIGLGVDGSHGYERTHLDSLTATSDLVLAYVQSPLTFARDKDNISSLKGFPHQLEREVIQIKT